MNTLDIKYERAQKYVDGLLSGGLEYSAAFIPQSQSRNADEDQPSLNWRVVIAKGGARITTDYGQGVAHLPHYSQQFARLVVYDNAVREACETGKSRLLPRKNNGYDACQEDRHFKTGKPVPPPALVDVLWCLVMDAGVIDYAGFEEWASEYEYDTDSRKAETVYRACLDTALKLRQILDLDEAREAFEGY